MTRIVMLVGEPEYCSDRSMRPIADLLAKELDAQVSYRTPNILMDEPVYPESSFGDLSVLDGADLLVVYTRFRRLPDSEMESLQTYLARDAPVIGLRTSSHAFHYSPGERWACWNDGFGRDVLGSPWVRHHGHSSSTDVAVVPGIEHPIVSGLPSTFHVRSWLYTTDLAPNCRPLMTGTPVEPESEPEPGPVAWTREDNRRTFYTSLGHPEDLEMPVVQQLLINAARWAVAG